MISVGCSSFSKLTGQGNWGKKQAAAWFVFFMFSAPLFLPNVCFAQSSAFTYEGRLFSSSGVPLLESIDVKFQILNPAGTCVLYEEVQTGIDLSASKGAFSLGVGSAVSDAKRSANFRGAYNPSMISVFKNGATLSSIPAAGCAAGTYVAGSSDSRLLRVHVTKGSTTETLSPDLVINTVPSAQVAASLQGFLPSDFLRLDVANGISGNIGLTATGTGAGQTREFRFYELAANGPEYSAFKAPDAMATSLTYVLPSSAPAAGDILKATVPSSGVVTLSWGADAGAGGGISSFNGSNQSSQSFTAVDIAAAVTAPAWSTNAGTGAHTLQIPMAAGAGVTGGLITKTEHTAFSSKVDRAGDTMTGLLNFTGATGISLANTSGITFTGTGTIAMGTNKITGMADPSNAQEAATKAYVDSQNSGKIGGTLTATRIPYASGASTLVDSADFTYTTATGAMTIGGTAPSITSNDAITIAAGGTNKNVVLTPSGTGYTVLNGNVGIGTATPGKLLDVYSAAGTNLFRLRNGTNSIGIDIAGGWGQPGMGSSSELHLTDSAGAIILNRGGSPAGMLLSNNNALFTFAGIMTNSITSATPAAATLAGVSGSGADIAGASISIAGGRSTGTGVGGSILFKTSAASGSSSSTLNSYATAMTINSAGSVGIGTGSPSYQLDVANLIRGNYLVSNNGLLDSNGNRSMVGKSGNILQIANDGTWTNITLHTGASATERLRVDVSGNVGIGTTAPASKLHIGAAPTASANFGLVSLGNGAFDGTTAGYFGTGATSSANGTILAANAATGYTGDLINVQIGGAQKFKVDKDGKIYGDGSTLSNVSGALSGLTSGRVPVATSSTTVGDYANFTYETATNQLTLAGTPTTSALAITGAPAAAATKSLVQLGAALAGGSANGTYVGINAANGYAGNLLDLQVNGAQKFVVDQDGILSNGPGATYQYSIDGRYGYFAATKYGASQYGGQQYDFALEVQTASVNSAVSHLSGRDNFALHWSSNNNYSGTIDTGISRNAAGVIEINNGTAGSYRDLRLRSLNPSGGNVGIGTTAPLLPLHVLGAATTTNLGQGRSVLFLDDSTAMATGVGGGIFFRGLMDGTNYRPWAGIQGVKENATSGNGAGTLLFLTRPDGSTPTERMRIDSSGNVGIGTTTPTAGLHLNSSTGLQLTDGTNGTISNYILANGTNGAYITMSARGGLNFVLDNNSADGNDDFVVYPSSTGNSPLFFIRRTTGNVGIGTPSPSATLDVNGHISVSSSGTPALSGCGTSPVITGNDTRGKITFGTGTVTSCTVTFAAAYATAPICVTTATDSASIASPATITTTVLTLTTAANAAGNTFNYVCIQ